MCLRGDGIAGRAGNLAIAIFCVRISMTSLVNMDIRKMCWHMSESVKIGIFLVPSNAPAPETVQSCSYTFQYAIHPFVGIVGKGRQSSETNCFVQESGVFDSLSFPFYCE